MNNMNYFLDTEFSKLPWEEGSQLISLGIVDEMGKSYYACLNDFDETDVSDFVKERVLLYLPDKSERKSSHEVAQDLVAFFGDTTPSHFWSVFPKAKHLESFGLPEDQFEYVLKTYADFDFQLLKRVMGDQYPENWLQSGSNLTPFVDKLKEAGALPENKATHNALSDALWGREVRLKTLVS